MGFNGQGKEYDAVDTVITLPALPETLTGEEVDGDSNGQRSLRLSQRDEQCRRANPTRLFSRS